MKSECVDVFDRAVSLCLKYPGYRVLMISPRLFTTMTVSFHRLRDLALKCNIRMYSEIRDENRYLLSNGSRIQLCGADGDVFGEHAATEFDMIAFMAADGIPRRTIDFLVGNLRGYNEFPKYAYYDGHEMDEELDDGYEWGAHS